MSSEKECVLRFIAAGTGLSRDVVESAIKEIITPKVEQPEPALEDIIQKPKPLTAEEWDQVKEYERLHGNRNRSINPQAFLKR